MKKKISSEGFLKNLLDKFYIFFVEFSGVLLFLFALSTIVSLISYCPDDSSLNTAIDGHPLNLLSLPGSVYADFMLQLFGIGSYVFSAVLLSFGYQLMRYHYIIFFRILFGFLSTIFTSVFLSIFIKDTIISGSLGQYILKIIFSYIKINTATKSYWILIASTSTLLLISLFIAIRIDYKGLYQSLKEFSNTIVTKKVTLSPVEEEELIEKIRIMPVSNKKSSSTKTLISPPKPKSGFIFPSLSLLRQAQFNGEKLSENALKERSANLLHVLNDFGINGEIKGVSQGPVVTLYELCPAAGIKSSRVIGLSNDIARYMSAVSARVVVVPGKNVLGIELPNVKRQTVYLREVLESSAYSHSASSLPIALGKDIFGDPVIADLAKMPHLLIAGTTGSGKSVGINAMILSLLYRLSPSDCKFIMIDPKMLELSVYDDIPHLLTPVVTDPKKAVIALKWAVKEMESRYMTMSKLGVRNIDGYNAKIQSLKESGEQFSKKIHTGFDPETGKPIYENQTLELEPIPYIVIIVDEMADLMLVAGKDIEVAVQRLAQMARAAGIHLIMATQRPSVDVITGTIKANFPTRISFQVSSKIDSRTILGDQGAEQLLGQGDMLYMASGAKVIRVHCPFVSDAEVEKVAENLKAQGEPHYITTILEDEEEFSDKKSDGCDDDPLYQEAVSLILREGKASTSFLQRHLKIGYNRAARIIDKMEANGMISAANHVGKREVIR